MPPGPLPEIDVQTLWSAIEAAAEQARFAIFVARIDCSPPRMLYASERASQITGRSRAELLTMLPWGILRAEDQTEVKKLVERPVGAPPISFPAVVERPDGSHVPIEAAATRIMTSDGMVALGYFRDVSAEHATLAALRQSEARFRFLVEAAPDGVVILVRGKIVFINPRAERLLGIPAGESGLGRGIGEFLPPADAEATAARIAEMFRTGQEMPPSEYGVLADPDRVIEIKSIACSWDGGPAVLALARDVTERKALQRRLVEADRLAALGTLAAGVAHEINNPMTYALLAVQRIDRTLAGLGLPDSTVTALREQLGDVEHGIGRVASITRSLRAFARPDDAPPGAVDLAAVIDRSLQMVDNELRQRAQLVVDRGEIPWVIGNPSRLEQVVVNVLLNAIQALPEPGPHQIQVSLRHTADRVVLTVRDSGRGMTPAVRARIFEPFFTTRPVGDGMGLGLSVSKTIIDGFGGALDVVSSPGAGTTVTISLRAHTGPRPEGVVIRSGPHDRRKVLLIDDEPVLRNVFSQLLGRHHDVAAAGSGVEALLALEAATFDVIVCDVMMQGMNGCELYRRIAATYPGLERRVVFITGGTFTREIDDFLAATPNQVLTKPFNLESILATIEHAARSALA